MQNPLDGLNPRQREAVESLDSRLLVSAGAGSGKTRVLVARLAFMLDSGIGAHSLLAVTFTNKAANEMRARALSLRPRLRYATVSTFHSFGAHFLRDYAYDVGLSRHFSIYDDDDSLAVLKRLYPKEPANALKELRRYIERAKNRGLSPDDCEEDIGRAVYAAYQKALRENSAVDFGDLVLMPLQFLQSDARLKAEVESRYRAVLVDEFQDTNPAQALLLDALSGPKTFITVVGDEDQSIYRFRGAEPVNILDFPERHAPCRVVKLEQNYRSTGHILACAQAVISLNLGRLGKTLFTNLGVGKKPLIAYLPSQDDETSFCADLLRDGRLEETAILYRTNAQSRSFEECFIKRGIPYRLVGSVRFYEREEIKTALAFLTLLVNGDDRAAFSRAINKPARGVGKTSIEKILGFKEAGESILVACEKSLKSLKGKAAIGVTDFILLYKKIFTVMESGEPLYRVLQFALEDSGLKAAYIVQDRLEGTYRVDNLVELVDALEPYGSGVDSLNVFLENVRLNIDEAAKPDATEARVTLTTLHNAKGLEYERVVMTGIEEGIFPRPDAFEGDPREEMEEERRLFYVGVTRARAELIFTYCERRRLYGRTSYARPSRFLSELPEEHVEKFYAPGISAEYESRYIPGSFVRHEEYGVGRVVTKKVIGDRLVIEVKFAGGLLCKFLPEFIYLEKVDPNALE